MKHPHNPVDTCIEPKQDGMSEAQIDYMVKRFLCWRLPEKFSPDGGIIFSSANNRANGTWPTGTNLFDAEQARVMIQYLTFGLPNV